MCTFYKGHTQDIVFCQRLQYDENGEKELFFVILEVSKKKKVLVWFLRRDMDKSNQIII